MQITSKEFKKYISSHRSCSFTTQGCVLSPRNSLLSLDLSFIEYDCQCTLQFKRRSGNGKMVIKANGKGNAATARATTLQGITVTLGEDKKLEVLRVKDCSGELILCSIDVQRIGPEPESEPKSEPKSEPNSKPKPKPPVVIVPEEMDWGTVIKMCGGSKGLKLSNEILYASEGAILKDGSKITSVETEPPNVTKRVGKKIQFIYPCQVLSILSDGYLQDKNEKYVHMHRPATVVVLGPKNSPPTSVDVSLPLPIDPVENVYDSQGSNLYLNAQGRKGVVNSGGSRITVKRGGEFTLPISNLSSNMLYTLAITLQKISGNGRISLSFSGIAGAGEIDLIAPARAGEVFANLNSGVDYVGGGYSLRVFRPEKSVVGEVMIDRIRIVHGVPIDPGPRNIVLHVDHTTKTPCKSLLRKTTDYSLREADEDIKNTFKHFSVLECPRYENIKVHEDISCPIQAIGRNAEQWFNKISPIFPNIRNKPGVAVCSIEDLIESPTVWIEEFDHNASAHQLVKLKNSNVICTPSLTNLYVLRRWMPGKNIQLRHRPWPILGPKQEAKESYCIYLEKDSNVTDMLVDVWKQDFGALYVVGARRKFPNHIHYISEYEPYSELYNKIAGAYGIIDISANSHYISGVLELATALGLQVATNNHKYLSSTPYIIRNSRGNSEYYVSPDDISRVISRFVKGNYKTVPHNYNIKQLMGKFLEIKW